MARKSERLSSSASRAATTHKRAASSTATPSAETKRSRTNKATPTKSQYFDSKDDSDAGGDISDEESESVGGEGSDFDEGAEESGSPEPDDEDDYESEDEPKRRKKSTPGKTSQTSTTIRTKGNDVWKTGVKTGLGPGNQVVIKKPKARPAGDTPYTDDTLHPNTLLFLSELKENNNREWLKSKSPCFPSVLSRGGESVPTAHRWQWALHESPHQPSRNHMHALAACAWSVWIPCFPT